VNIGGCAWLIGRVVMMLPLCDLLCLLWSVPTIYDSFTTRWNLLRLAGAGRGGCYGIWSYAIRRNPMHLNWWKGKNY